MSDDLRDKFGSDDEYDDFKKSYSDFKSGSGMFDASNQIKEFIEFEKLLYDSFIIEGKKYIKLPERYVKSKNMPLYIFYLNTLPDTDTITRILN